MRKENKILFFGMGLGVLSIILIILIVYSLFPFFSQFKTNNANRNDIINNCSNLSLKNSAICLRENVAEFYQYVETPDTLDLSEKEIRSRGGDCRNYAMYYGDLGKELGFYTTEARMQIDESTAHVVTIISNEKAYCILDQLNVACLGLG
jgi:hypothetical protein